MLYEDENNITAILANLQSTWPHEKDNGVQVTLNYTLDDFLLIVGQFNVLKIFNGERYLILI